MKLIDKYNREHSYLRISLTGKCNLNCIYCNPIGSFNNDLSKNDILSFDEIESIIRLFVLNGFKKIRFTGGEPLARKDFIRLFERISCFKKENPYELSITTNGILFDSITLSILKRYGLDSINISLDSLNTRTFKKITGHNKLPEVLNGIKLAKDAGFKNIKINSVIIKGLNDSEILDFCDFAVKYDLIVRFIEFMPFSNNEWGPESFISAADIMKIIQKKYTLEEISNNSNVAKDFQIGNERGKIGFISSISQHFCEFCNRLRITADGKLKLCLFSPENELFDLKSLLKDKNYDEELILKEISHYMNFKELEHKPLSELIKMKNNNMVKIGG